MDLAAVRANARAVRGKLGSGVLLCAVVKADAYGHGGAAVARALEDTADCFAVALCEEGAELRLAGVRRPVLVLLPAEREDLPRALFYGLTLAADSLRSLAEIERAARRAGTVASVHIAVNTGMNRVGVTRRDRFERMCARAAASPFLVLSGVFSHFAGEDPSFTALQHARFRRRVALARRYAPHLIAHIAASSHLAEVRYQEDMVRAGLALYGYGAEGVTPAMTLKARAVCRRKVRAGERLMYAESPEREDVGALIVRAGYADGLPRSGLPYALRPLAMDTAAIADGGEREAELIGKTQRADDLAKAAGTIPYELLTKALMRAERVYIE